MRIVECKNCILSAAFISSCLGFLCIIILAGVCLSSEYESLCLLLFLRLLSWIGAAFSNTSSRCWNSREGCCQIFKKLLDVNSNFGTCFNKHGLKFICESLSFLGANLPLLSQIYFVSNYDDCDIVTPDVSCLLNPTGDVFKTLFRRDIVNNHCYLTIINVRRNQRPKSFLAGSVPKLQSNHFVVDINCFS